MIGQAHTAYLGLVEELGLTLDPMYTSVAGATTYDLVDGVRAVRGRVPVRNPSRARGLRTLRAAVREARRQQWIRRIRGRIRRSAARRRFVAAWLRPVAAPPTTVRPSRPAPSALAAGSSERTSLLAELRKAAAVSERGLLLVRPLGVAPGRRGIGRGGALRMGSELGVEFVSVRGLRSFRVTRRMPCDARRRAR